MPRANARHDVGLVALAIFGATTFALGLTSANLALPAWATASIAIVSAVVAAFSCAAIEPDVTRGEAAFAAALATPIAFGLQWLPPAWSTHGSVPWLVGATLASAALAWLITKRAPSAAPTYRVIVVMLLCGGIGGVLFLGALVVGIAATKGGMMFVPWTAAIGTSAFCAWRQPKITNAQIFIGEWLAVVIAFVMVVPMSKWADESVYLSGLLGAVVAAVGTGLHEVFGAYLDKRPPPPKAHVRDV